MVTWTIPAVMILHKELVPLREDRFVVTYEYSWCKSTEDNGLGRREWSQAGTDVDIVDSCSWVNMTVSVLEDNEEGGDC